MSFTISIWNLVSLNTVFQHQTVLRDVRVCMRVYEGIGGVRVYMRMNEDIRGVRMRMRV